jgi:hypothetical protein
MINKDTIFHITVVMAGLFAGTLLIIGIGISLMKVIGGLP